MANSEQEITAVQTVVDAILVNLFAAAYVAGGGTVEAFAFKHAEAMLAESKLRGHADVAAIDRIIEAVKR